MRSYELRYEPRRGKASRVVELEASNVQAALVKAHGVASVWPHEIWQDGKRLCSIEHHAESGQDIWVLAD